MNYEIKTIRVPFVTGKVLEYEAEHLCKLIEAKPVSSPVVSLPAAAELDLVVLERWGSTKAPNYKHKVVILREGQPFNITLPYEPILSRRGKFTYGATDFYLFQL